MNGVSHLNSTRMTADCLIQMLPYKLQIQDGLSLSDPLCKFSEIKKIKANYASKWIFQNK